MALTLSDLMTILSGVLFQVATYRRGACWLALGGALLLPLSALADKPQWAYRTYPFAQALNLHAAYEVTHSTPEQLIPTIRRWGVGVQLVRSEASVVPVNPLLAGLPTAAPELVHRVDFRDTYEGMVVYDSLKDSVTILIRDTTPCYTLIHEFVQSLLRPLHAGVVDHLLEARFGAAHKRLVFYQRRLYDDPLKLLNPLWRRDILVAQNEVARDLFGRIRLGQSQEAIVEKLLSLYIDERSPFFDPARRAQGLQYGEAMINNAIDMFNVLSDSVVFVEDAVSTLRQSLRDGEIEPGEGVELTDDDEAYVARSARNVLAHLAVVGAELQALQLFYYH